MDSLVFPTQYNYIVHALPPLNIETIVALITIVFLEVKLWAVRELFSPLIRLIDFKNCCFAFCSQKFYL